MKTFSSIPFVKADTGLFIFEAGFRWNNVPDYKKDNVRYGRGFIFGVGISPWATNATGITSACSPTITVPDGQGGSVEAPNP